MKHLLKRKHLFPIFTNIRNFEGSIYWKNFVFAKMFAKIINIFAKIANAFKVPRVFAPVLHISRKLSWKKHIFAKLFLKYLVIKVCFTRIVQFSHVVDKLCFFGNFSENAILIVLKYLRKCETERFRFNPSYAHPLGGHFVTLPRNTAHLRVLNVKERYAHLVKNEFSTLIFSQFIQKDVY